MYSSNNNGRMSPFSDVIALETNDTQTESSPATFINPQDDSGPATSSEDLLLSASSATASASASATPMDYSHPLPLIPGEAPSLFSTTTAAARTDSKSSIFRSRKTSGLKRQKNKKRRRRPRLASYEDRLVAQASKRESRCCKPCRDRTFVRSTMVVMNILAKILVWSSVIALAAAVVWYSYELKNNGTDPHLIAWFSAGAFVLLGFPISIMGIVGHLANYNQPNVQCYIVRILWMVPIYSMESWLCLRFHQYSIYIETFRDCYESYVLYSFFQFLIQVLGGEEALILMLKDKSPTRGAHMWGLQWCIRPWLMGQPIRKVYQNQTQVGGVGSVGQNQNRSSRPLKRVYWKSPFFVKCKFAVLQYVLIKFLCSFIVVILEHQQIYKEGNFTYKGGYLYITFLTNLSQCWALYCLILFYYATKTELSPIRPVGKFLSVKALVFFTWWQSVFIAVLYQMDLIPHYHSGNGFTSGLLSEEDAVTLDEQGGSGVVTEWTSEDVAKGLQDYLICIEMFVAAIVHAFVFPHTEYSPDAVEARSRALNQTPHKNWNKRLGRKWKDWDNKSSFSGATNTSSASDQNIDSLGHPTSFLRTRTHSEEDDDLMHHPMDAMTAVSTDDEDDYNAEHRSLLEPVLSEGSREEGDDNNDNMDDYSSASSESFTDDDEAIELVPILPVLPKQQKQGFVRALLDSSIPQDLRDNTVGLIKGDYVVEKKTLLHHAATSDSYDLFSRVTPRRKVVGLIPTTTVATIV